APFEALSAAPMAMTAHIAFDAIDADAPVTLSSKAIEAIIRRRIGFDGLLMTDDLGMNALGGPLASRARRALEAGCDVVLHCAGFTKAPEGVLSEMEEVADACEALSGKSLERALVAETYTTKARPFDAEAGWERLRALLPKQEAAA
ncbi:MAG: glycoside hydrolase family 3 N-terminal domain-containing protein, partial [Pseudomonadota bacterium]